MGWDVGELGGGLDSWLVTWQLCCYSVRYFFPVQKTGESCLRYLGTIRLDSSLVMVFIGPKDVLGFKFILYMSTSFAGSWITQTLCISSHVMMWSCQSIVFCALVTRVPSKYCTPLESFLDVPVAPDAGMVPIAVSITVFTQKRLCSLLQIHFWSMVPSLSRGMWESAQGMWGSSWKTEVGWENRVFVSQYRTLTVLLVCEKISPSKQVHVYFQKRIQVQTSMCAVRLKNWSFTMQEGTNQYDVDTP